MKNTVTTKWTGDLSFDALVTGHHIIMDVAKESGGQDSGPRPKAMLLASLMGCSGMDIVSILKKMKVADYSFEMSADADAAEEHPMVYTTINLQYMFKGENLPEDKIVKAVALSTEKYCAVNAMLKQTANLNIQIFINESEVKI